MQVSKNIELNFSEEVPSNSRVVNPLGIWGHLNLQDDFVPGITSVTNRIRYYTLQAWYYQNLFDDKVIPSKDFERVFILTCLAHHNGDSSHPDLHHIHNKHRFDDVWDDREVFGLDFDIAGFGRTYYIAQLEVFRCAWTDKLDRTHYTKLNERLADSLNVSVEAFEQEEYSKDYLRENLSELCVCNENEQEIEILSKIFFGFFSKQDGEWDLDEEEFERFEEGDIELSFDEEYKSKEFGLEEATRQKNLRRRNTLFLFLKVISETEPSDVKRTIWDALYYSQERGTGRELDFGGLERGRRYWEYFQLNLYYVYSIEILLDVLQNLVRNNNGIEREQLLSKIDDRELRQYLTDTLGEECETVRDIFSAIEDVNDGKRTDLDKPINESKLYSQIKAADDWKQKAVLSLLLLFSLKFRYDQTPGDIKANSGNSPEEQVVQDSLNIELMFDLLEKSRGQDWVEFLQDLIQKIKRRHVFEASRRLKNSNTRSWLFTEEEGRLFFARQKPINIRPRDNRWGSIELLLTDLNFIEEEDGKISLTEKGESWLQRIE